MMPTGNPIWPLPGQIHVWHIGLPSAGARARSGTPLSADERERVARLRAIGRGGQYAAARMALRNILAAYLGIEPSAVRFTYGAYGKPELAGNHRTLTFNLSHSGTLGLCAVASETAVGIDVEAVRAIPDACAVARDVFTATEIDQIAALPSSLQDLAFLTGWTRKEAVLKATGAALAASAREVEVTLTPGLAPTVLSWRGSRRAAAGWWLHDLELPHSHVGALAFRGAACTVRRLLYPSRELADRERLRCILRLSCGNIAEATRGSVLAE